MQYAPPQRLRTLAQRSAELMGLKLKDATSRLTKTALTFDFSLQPAGAGRQYRCRLQVWRDRRWPTLSVLSPDLHALAGGRRLPHIYASPGPGTVLCLWHPKSRDFSMELNFGDTYIPWAVEWLGYFEDWLYSNEWLGGGVHGEVIEDWKQT